MTTQIRTFIEDENTSSSFDKDRGARNWSAAQIMSPLSFVVDICVEVGCKLETKRWITTSILEVVLIQKIYKPFVWAQVFLSARTPHDASGGFLFEEVSEAYQTGRVNSYIYRLTNGKAFMPDNPHTAEDEGLPSHIKLVYSKQEISAVQYSIYSDRP
jgi:hypothetical protein